MKESRLTRLRLHAFVYFSQQSLGSGARFVPHPAQLHFPGSQQHRDRFASEAGSPQWQAAGAGSWRAADLR